MRDLVRHAAEHAPGSLHPAAADHDQVRVDSLTRDRHDRVGRGALRGVLLDLDAVAADALERLLEHDVGLEVRAARRRGRGHAHRRGGPSSALTTCRRAPVRPASSTARATASSAVSDQFVPTTIRVNISPRSERSYARSAHRTALGGRPCSARCPAPGARPACPLPTTIRSAPLRSATSRRRVGGVALRRVLRDLDVLAARGRRSSLEHGVGLEVGAERPVGGLRRRPPATRRGRRVGAHDVELRARAPRQLERPG